MVPPGFFAPAFPYMPMAPFQAMGMAAPPAADNKGKEDLCVVVCTHGWSHTGWDVARATEGMKALECLMSLLVDEMRDVKRGLTGLHQEFAELRFVLFRFPMPGLASTRCVVLIDHHRHMQKETRRDGEGNESPNHARRVSQLLSSP
jgi:hypothetical protein